MKNKLLLTLVALMLIVGIGCTHAVGGAGVTGGHSAMMGGHGGTGQQGATQDSDTSSGHSRGATGHEPGSPYGCP
jgi:hypothetical protein